MSRSSGSREAEQQDRRSRKLGHVLDEVEERRRRPVQVLEHEDDRPLPRECLEQPASGPGRLLDGACRRRFARRRSDPRRDELAVPLAREDAGGPRRDAPARKRGEGIAERRVRGGLAVGGCAADHAGRSFGKALDRLVGETRLAHAGGAEHRDEARSAVAARAPEGRHDLGELVLAPDERRLEAADDRFGVVQHAADDVVAASPLSGDRVTDEAPRSLADEHVRLAGGGAQPIGLLERRARDERPPEGGIAGDDVAGGDTCTSDEPAGDERAGGANGAKRVVLARHGNTEDPENARVRRASGGASVGIEGCDGFLAAPAELVTPQLRVGAGVGGQVGEQEGDRLARLLDSSAGFRLHCGRRPRELRVLAQDRTV